MAQYTQDYDEWLVPQSLNGQNWTVFIRPYLKSSEILICPDEKRRSCLGGASQFFSNYGYNTEYQPGFHPLGCGGRGLGWHTDWELGNPDADPCCVGHTGVFRLSQIEEASNTLAMADAVTWSSDPAQGGGGNIFGTGAPFVWWKDGNNPIPGAGTNANDYKMDPRHFEGANILFCDGHVKWRKTPVGLSLFTVAPD